MTILAIETATEICAVALVANGALLAEISREGAQIHSENLMLLVDELLAHRGGFSSVGAIAVSIGPGSFTGLRIGCGTAKGLAYALDLPVIPVSTLEALAFSALPSGGSGLKRSFFPIITSRREEVFGAVYSQDGPFPRELVPPRAFTYEQALAELSRHPNITLTGNAGTIFSAWASAKNPEMPMLTLAPPDIRKCSAAAVAGLAEKYLSERKNVSRDLLEPNYIKDFYTLVQPRVPAH
jgi:tRNA threonylcarbamoyladenosine biosynthesis protein TsaB